MDAFDADVLIYAAADTPEGARVIHLSDAALEAGSSLGVGSVLLLAETLTRPLRHQDDVEARRIAALLGQLVLHPCDAATAMSAVDLGARYGLRALDAVHLATAVRAGADRFITNNRRDFSKDIDEIAVTYPEDLDESAD